MGVTQSGVLTCMTGFLRVWTFHLTVTNFLSFTFIVVNLVFFDMSSRIDSELLGMLDYQMAAQRISRVEGGVASFASESVFRHVSVPDLRDNNKTINNIYSCTVNRITSVRVKKLSA